MPAKKDYYELLGVPRTADTKQIKAAYRKLARKYHPDVNKDDASAESRFKEIAEAFAVLSDKEQRARYDRGGHEAFGSGFDPFAGHSAQDFDFGFGDISELFRMFGGFGGAGPRSARRVRRGNDLKLELRVPFMDAALGSTVELSIPRQAACADCGGGGVRPGTGRTVCPDCRGSGRAEQRRGRVRLALTCQRCGGSGRLPGEPCPRCQGSGLSREQKKVKVRIPAGIEDGNTVRVAGKGDAGMNGGPAGDAYLVVRIEPHPLFRREGNDLFCDVPIGLATAGLGGTARVPTLEGETTINVPDGTRSGQKLRLREKGIQLKDGRRGDLYAVLQIHPPKKLDKRSRELLEEFQQLNPEP